MRYWRIKINHGRGSVYTVYYKSLIDISFENVARNAIIDGDLPDLDLLYVEKVEEISKDEYLQFMWD